MAELSGPSPWEPVLPAPEGAGRKARQEGRLPFEPFGGRSSPPALFPTQTPADRTEKTFSRTQRRPFGHNGGRSDTSGLFPDTLSAEVSEQPPLCKNESLPASRIV
jgi:hypothetical protein